MKLKVKYLFPTSSSGANFFIDKLPKIWKLEKKCYVINMLSTFKRIYKPGLTFSGFSRTFIEISGFKVQLDPPHGNFSNGYSNSSKSPIVPWKYLYVTNGY